MSLITSEKSEVDIPFEKWMWIDFFGLDNKKSDFGIGEFLDSAGFIPQGISLLISNADFVHTHMSLEDNKEFPADYCAYGEFNYRGNEECRRQVWTAFQLRDVVREFQRKGVEVFFSLFDIFSSKEWIGKHPELWHLRKNGERIEVLCPWKRLSDGGYYEDFFVQKLSEVVADYGFDGFHCADGYAHQRIPISEGDFSDDMVEQFVQMSGLKLDFSAVEPCEGNPSLIESRADEIWRNFRAQWIKFYAARTTRFIRKVVDVLHGAKKLIIINSAWTKDPFEALYRYGVDYAAIGELGVDAFVVETAAGAAELDGFERIMGHRPIYSFLAAVLLLRACAPRTRLLYLNGIKDSTEGWSVLRHAPPTLEAEINLFGSLFSLDRSGFKRCLTGPMACTADGIKRHEWDLIKEWWNTSFEFQARRVVGITLVWSDGASRDQLDDYIQTRRWPAHRWVQHLLERNVPIYSIVNVRDLELVKGPILILNPHLFASEELASIDNYDRGPTVLMGFGHPPSNAVDGISEKAAKSITPYCSIFGTRRGRVDLIDDCSKEDLVDILSVRDPSGPHAMFYHELYFSGVSDDFLSRSAESIVGCIDGIQVLDGKEAKTIVMEGYDGRRRLVVGNDSHWYLTARIDVGASVGEIRTVTRFPYITIEASESSFEVRVPGRGVTIVDVDAGSQLVAGLD